MQIECEAQLWSGSTDRLQRAMVLHEQWNREYGHRVLWEQLTFGAQQFFLRKARPDSLIWSAA